MSEKLRLVTDFAELRAGSLVVVKGCTWCGGAHRAILTKFVNDARTQMSPGHFVVSPSWRMEPTPAHSDGLTFWLIKRTVDRGGVYLVDTGLEQATETTTRKRQPKPARAT